ncbi:tetratricopeptide repeat protein, partial [Acinetobacter baumannii]|nr:tetratricopeptide repeat protein [Acinetobacter baumannii]
DKDKNSVDAMTALAALEMQQKRVPEATAWLEKASDANPTALGAALRLGGHYLATEQAPKAQALARKLQTNHPADPGVLELLGQTQVASKDLP